MLLRYNLTQNKSLRLFAAQFFCLTLPNGVLYKKMDRGCFVIGLLFNGHGTKKES